MNLVAAIAGAVTATAVVAPASLAPPPSFGDFTASRHGFAFVNHFTGSSLPGPLVLLHGALNAPSEYGLCGGMCFAAADFYIAGRTPPRSTTPPRRGTALYRYIYQRQADSLGERLAYAAQFSLWMDMPDTGPFSASAASVAQLNDALALLDDGKPAHIGLVYISSKQTREPWHNHQVLATSYRLDENDGGATACSLRIYDPNYPGDDGVRIDLALALEGFERIGHAMVPVVNAECRRIVTERPPRRVRGVFLMPYSPKVPPNGLR